MFWRGALPLYSLSPVLAVFRSLSFALVAGVVLIGAKVAGYRRRSLLGFLSGAAFGLTVGG